MFTKTFRLYYVYITLSVAVPSLQLGLLCVCCVSNKSFNDDENTKTKVNGVRKCALLIDFSYLLV